MSGGSGTDLLRMLRNGFFDGFLKALLYLAFQFIASLHSIGRYNCTVFVGTTTVATATAIADQFHRLTGQERIQRKRRCRMIALAGSTGTPFETDTLFEGRSSRVGWSCRQGQFANSTRSSTTVAAVLSLLG